MKEIFVICDEDVQNLALKKIGRNLTQDELHRVKNGIEFGLECWEEIAGYAIKEVIVENIK